MITLFCDLDNTIIYSHRRPLDTEKRVAEMIDGIEQSYITDKTFSFLATCKSISVIPVTTRTLQQYERVKPIFKSFNCKYALVMNGAILIRDGIIDDAWLNESKELVKRSAEEMIEVAEMLRNDKAVSLKYHDIFLVYASASSPEEVSSHINNTCDRSLIHSFFDSRKVYCTPSVLTKGNAVRRLTNLLMPELSFAVGDSENDLSMFECVDVPIVPSSLETMVKNQKKVIVAKDRILSDAACEVIKQKISNMNEV